MSNKYSTELQNSFNSKKINQYMLDKLSKVIVSGVNDNLFQHLMDDAQQASDIGVSSDNEYSQYFYICHFLDDILNDTFDIKFDNKNHKNDFCKYFLSKKINLKDLTDLRILIHEWLCNKLSKKAYPNISGKYTRNTVYDRNKWALALQHIFNLVNVNGLNKDTAFENLTKGWDEEEKFNFKNWIKYYEEGNVEKYKVKTAKFIKEAFGPVHINLPENLLNNRSTIVPPTSTFQANDHKSKKELELDRAKSLKAKMKSRIRALKMLMDKYNDILPHQDLDKLFGEVHSLEKSISKLNVYASLQDRVACAANRMVKLGFPEGAEILLKEAEEPLPQQTNTIPQISSNANVKNIIAKLEAVSKELAARNLIRELAIADILLNNIGMAAIFPELSLAQSKLIEGFGYASNKVEDVLARLRGTEQPKIEPAPLPTAPAPQPVAVKPEEKIQTEELMDKPVGKIETNMPTNMAPKK
jgi:hypothetical protein